MRQRRVLGFETHRIDARVGTVASAREGKLIYAARTRNGFTPVTRAQLFKKFKGLEIHECPFANRTTMLAHLLGEGDRGDGVSC